MHRSFRANEWHAAIKERALAYGLMELDSTGRTLGSWRWGNGSRFTQPATRYKPRTEAKRGG
jgi:hypothetical protein